MTCSLMTMSKPVCIALSPKEDLVLYQLGHLLTQFVDLPPGSEIVSVRPAGASAWVETVRIDVRLSDGSLKSYFKKV